MYDLEITHRPYLYYRIGEKFLDWTDDDPSLDLILESVTLYWLTGCMPTSVYPYRQVSADGGLSPTVCFSG